MTNEQLTNYLNNTEIARLKQLNAELVAAAKRYLKTNPVYKAKPLGPPGSFAKRHQDESIEAEKALIEVIAKAEGVR